MYLPLIRRPLTALAIAVSALMPLLAQDSGFDLNSQRGEKQEHTRIPGYKIDHQGLVINPTPHQMQIQDGEGLDANAGFTVKDTKGKFQKGELDFLKQAKGGTKLNINFGVNEAQKLGVKPIEGAYYLSISPKGIDITGYDEAGAFYGLQTLRQILESERVAQTSKIPLLTVNDYPSLPYRGVVEGFYGTPWSHEVRLSLIDYYGRNKMNNYIFGPKDDPYHSSPYWRLPYPEDEAKKIHELVEAADRNRVNFVWAIHPGKDIRWNKEDYDSLVSKFNMMYDLGVRAFAIFFDDIEGEGTDSNKQVELLNNLTNDFVKAKGDVANLMICPTDYSQLWANPSERGQLAIYGNKLNPDVEVFWTGEVVCSDLTPETLEFVNSRIKRPALYWWNFPVTDYARHIIMQGPVYGLDTNLTSEQVIGIESNPMEHGEASKLALYGVADWAWNIADYNPIDNWERGLRDLMPEAADVYRTFAIHSTDTETGYRRDESWETTTFRYDDYTPAEYDALYAEFERVANAQSRIEAESTNELLKGELHPWLVEFTKLGQRGLKALDLIKIYEGGNDSIFWTAYVDNIMSLDDKKAYDAHKSGTMKLQPFYENAMDDMLVAYFKKITGKAPMMPKAVGSYPNLRTTQPKMMLDNDTTTYYTSGRSQGKGNWVGLDLGAVRKVGEVNVRQGRNSVDDTDYFERVILQASVDGKEWVALTDSLEKAYVINWEGEPVDAQYVRLLRLDSPRRSWFSARTFDVNPPRQERIGLNVAADDIDSALLAFDENPASFARVDGTVTFDRPADTESIIILANKIESPLIIELYDGDGNTIGSSRINTPWSKLSLAPETKRISITGKANIHEIIH